MPGDKRRASPDYANYEHKDADRPNLPTNEMADDGEVRDISPGKYNFPEITRSQPRLAWQRSWRPDEPVVHRPLFIQEKIHPGALVHGLRREVADPNMTLFKEFNGLTDEQYTQWYKHKGRWQNRLIHGNALEISASLAEREGLAGKVQMIYFDPPYGINFKSNFSVKAGEGGGKEDSSQVGADPHSIKAFLDTWNNGIHSYLDAIHKHAQMARALLAETGSLFVQMGDENMMRVGLVLDEVFGAENRVATICFATSGASSAASLPDVGSYLLWYAKDRQEMQEHKYFQVYESLESRADVVELMNWHVMLEEKDGSTRNLENEEKERPDACLPKDARLFRRMPLASQHHSATGRSEPYIWAGRTFPCPPDSQWSVSHEGLARLAEKNRLIAQEGEKAHLGWRRYEDEIPGRKINNIWHRQMSPSDKRYVVQTADSVVERCLLMSTEPGDLVLDFTCGSGTTPFVAEKWGRRWIAMDASQVAIATARTRLATSLFDYHAISGTKAGQDAESRLRENPQLKSVRGSQYETSSQDPADGFVYRRVPRVSAAILAYDREEKTPPIYLVDQPVRLSGVTRICSPFTVESDRPYRFLDVEEAISDDPAVREAAAPWYASHQKETARIMTQTGIRLLDEGRHLQVENLEDLLTEPLTHVADCRYSDEAEETGRKAVIAFAPEDATVSPGLMRQAGQMARQQLGRKVDLVLVCGFAFAPDTNDFRTLGTLPIHRVQMNRQLQIEEVSIQGPEDNAFVMLGEPDVELLQNGDDYQVEVKGFATFDSSSGNARFGKQKDIYCWLLDTDYDGRSFFARHMHFPGQHNDKHIQKLKKELGRVLDTAAWEAMLSHKSRPFPKPNSGQLAVKIITRTGDEMIRVLTVA